MTCDKCGKEPEPGKEVLTLACPECRTVTCSMCRSRPLICPVCQNWMGAKKDDCKVGGGGCGN